MADKPTYEELEQRIKELEGQRSGHLDLDLAALFQGFEDSFPVGITDHKGVLLYVNNALEEMWGYSGPGDIIGRQLAEFWEGPGIYRTMEDLATKGWSMGEDIGKRNDGSLFPVEYKAIICKNIDGNPLYVLGQFIDISEKKRAEETLRKSEDRFRITAKETGQLLYSFDPKTGKVKWAGAIEAVTGYAYEEFQSFDIDAWAEQIHPDDREMVIQAMDEAVEHHTRFNTEYRFRCKDGSYIFVEERGAFVSGHESAPYPIVGTIRNIAERMRADEALKESESFFSQMFEQSTTSMCLYNPDGTINRVNNEFREMFGVEENVIINAGYNVFKDQATIDAGVIPLLREIFDEKKANNWETIFDIDVASASTGTPTSRAGKIFLEVFGYPVLNREGSLEYVLLQHYDITERKQAEEALRENEAFLKTLINAIPAPIFYKDRDGKYLGCNSAFETFSGETKERLIGKSVFDINPPELAEIYHAQDNELFNSGGMQCYESQWKNARGKLCDFIFNKAVFTDSKGVAGLIGVLIDITERKRAEKALKESEARLKKAQSVAKLGNWEYDISTGKIWGSEQAFRISGIERTSPYLPLDRIEASIPDAPRVNQALVDLIQENKPYDIEFEVQQEVDSQTILIHSIAELVYENDMPVKVLGVIQDVTEQNKAEKERKDLEYQLQRAQKMEALGLLAGGVAHDLNNILSGIVSYPELLLIDLPEDSHLRKPIKTIQESGMRAADVVEDLLTIARGVATGKEALSLNTLITEYMGSPEYEKLEKMHSFVDFKAELDPDLLNMSGSPTHIKKTLMNLVVNSSEAIEGVGTVTISTMNRYLDEPLKGYEDVRTGEYVLFIVSDDGSGISPGDLERIFEPFYTKKVMGKSGTGLGLAVVWNTVQDHNGYINVNTSDKGTVFELYFPVTREEVPAEGEQVPLEDCLGHGEKILVVDDEERQREIASGILTRLGYTAEAVSSGEDAIEYVKTNPVDLILLDMVMPKGINGRKTYEGIIKIRPGQKAIIASGYAKTKEVDLAQELGAGKYIKKPYTLPKVGVAVKAELEK